jgi:hypothetical protein
MKKFLMSEVLSAGRVAAAAGTGARSTLAVGGTQAAVKTCGIFELRFWIFDLVVSRQSPAKDKRLMTEN